MCVVCLLLLPYLLHFSTVLIGVVVIVAVARIVAALLAVRFLVIALVKTRSNIEHPKLPQSF